MIRRLFVALLALIVMHSCSETPKETTATSLDVGREFIRASLNGDFPVAEKHLLKDTQNLQLFDRYKSYYQRLPAEKKKHYKDASYEINKYVDVDSVTTIINYSNDYMNEPMDIKVIRENNEWKVDFKYTYSGNLPID